MASSTMLKPLPPAGDMTAPWVAKLRAAMFDGIKEEDVRTIVENLVKKAKAGDPGAIKMLFDYVLGGNKAARVETQNNMIIRPARRTGAEPGSRKKIEVLSERAAKGVSLHRDDDA
jgi:hypothetical protein